MRNHMFALLAAVTACAPKPVAPAIGPAGPHDDDPAPSSHVLVTTDQDCPASCPKGNVCHILEVLDIHTRATSEDKGFDELRARASALGGDAVIGAEFEHGDGDEPSHLSGMIVRGCDPIREYVELGAIDIPSDPISTDKGLAQLLPRAREMGGDDVLDVKFEHGDDGAQGHLRGMVIKFKE
jgi:uncharacterized protein YbjQ (UPF0145 family)